MSTEKDMFKVLFNPVDQENENSPEEGEEKTTILMRDAKKKWYNDNGKFVYVPIPENDLSQKLPVGVYLLQQSMNGFFLQYVEPKFEFPYKVYGNEESFVQRVVNTFNKIKGNLGVLLNGVKGTGKTVTAKQICNRLNLPVIIIPAPYQGLSAYFAEFDQDIIIFVDEFEKIYDMNKDPKAQDHLLSLMDGVVTKQSSRRLFLFTTNNSNINENMKSRPSRIRYIKTFNNLPESVLREIVDDILIHKEFTEQTVSFLKTLRNITIDIVKQVVYEVNLHKESPDNFKAFFNVEEEPVTYSVYEMLETPNQWGEKEKYVCGYAYDYEFDFGAEVTDFFLEIPESNGVIREKHIEYLTNAMQGCNLVIKHKNYGRIVDFDFDAKTITTSVSIKKASQKKLNELEATLVASKEGKEAIGESKTVFVFHKNPPSFYDSRKGDTFGY